MQIACNYHGGYKLNALNYIFSLFSKSIYRAYIIRSVYENITLGGSLECFSIIFGQFLAILRFDEKKVFFAHMTVQRHVRNEDVFFKSNRIFCQSLLIRVPPDLNFFSSVIVWYCRMLQIPRTLFQDPRKIFYDDLKLFLCSLSKWFCFSLATMKPGSEKLRE